MIPAIRIVAIPVFRKSVSVALMLSATALAGCASMTKPPAINYDATVPPLPAIPAAVTDERPKATRSPMAKPVTFSPMASTTPAPSTPGTAGSGKG